MAKKLTVFVIFENDPGASVKSLVRTLNVSRSQAEKEFLLNELRKRGDLPSTPSSNKKGGKNSQPEVFTPRALSQKPSKSITSSKSINMDPEKLKPTQETFFRQFTYSLQDTKDKPTLLLVFTQEYTSGTFYIEFDIPDIESATVEINYECKSSPPRDYLYLRKKNYLFIRLSRDGSKLSDPSERSAIHDLNTLIDLRSQLKPEQRFMENIENILKRYEGDQKKLSDNQGSIRFSPSSLTPVPSSKGKMVPWQNDEVFELSSEGSSATGTHGLGLVLKEAKRNVYYCVPKDNLFGCLIDADVELRYGLRNFILAKSEEAHSNVFVERIIRSYLFGKAFIDYDFLSEKGSNYYVYRSNNKLTPKSEVARFFSERVLQASKVHEREQKNIDFQNLDRMQQASHKGTIDSIIEARCPLRLNDLRDIIMDTSEGCSYKEFIPELALGQLQFKDNYNHQVNENPLMKVIIDSLSIEYTSDYFSSNTSTPLEPTDLFKAFIIMISRISYHYSRLLFNKLLKTTYSSDTKAIDTGARFVQLIFSNRMGELKQLSNMISTNDEYKNWYISWVADVYLPNDSCSGHLLSAIQKMIIEPFQKFATDSTTSLRRFYHIIINNTDPNTSIQTDRMDMEFCKHILESPLVDKELKLRFIKYRLLPQVTTEGSVGEKVIKSFFEKSTPFSCNEYAVVRTRDLLIYLNTTDDRDLFPDFRRAAMNKEAKDQLSLFIDSYNEYSIFHKIVEWLDKYLRSAILDMREYNIFMAYQQLISPFVNIQLKHPIKISVLTNLAKYSKSQIEMMACFEKEQTEESLLERVKVAQGKLEAFEKTYKEVHQEFFNREKVELYKDMPFFTPAAKKFAELKERKNERSVEEIESKEEWKDLVHMLDKGKDIFKALKKHSVFMEGLKKKSNNTVEEFMTNVGLEKDARKSRLEKFADDSKSMTLTDYVNNFICVSNPENLKSYNSLLTDLGVAEEITNTLVERSQRFECYVNIRKILNEGFLMSLVGWEKLKNIEKNSIELKQLNNLKDKIDKKGWTTNITYKDLEEMDKDNLTKRPQLGKLQPKLIENLSKSKELFKFVEENSQKFIDQLRNECDANYIDLLSKIQALTSKLGFLITLDAKETLDTILKKIYGLDPNDKLDELVGGLEGSLATLNHLKMKVTGDFKAIVEGIQKNSLFILKFDNKEEEFIYTAKSLTDAPKPGNMEKEVQNKKEDVEDNTFDMDDMTDHFTKAEIRCSEFDRIKKADPSIKEDNNQVLMAGFRDLGIEIKELKQNLTRMFELGIIPKGVDEGFVRYLNANSQNSPFSQDNQRLLLKTQGGNKKDMDAKQKEKGATAQELHALNNTVKELFKNLYFQYKENIEEKEKKDVFGYHLLTYFSREKMYSLIQFLKADGEVRKRNEFADTVDLLREATNNLDVQANFQNAKFDQTEINNTIKNVTELLNNCRVIGIDQPEQASSKVLVSRKVVVLNTERMIGFEGNELFQSRNKSSSSETNEYDILLKVFAGNTKKVLSLSQTFYCTERTTEIEVEAFVARCFWDPLRRQYFLLNPADLSRSALDTLLSSIHRMKDTEFRRLIIFDNLSNADTFSNQDFFQIMDDKIIDLKNEKKDTYLHSLVEKLAKITVVESDRSGEGKTFEITKMAGKLRILAISIAGEINKFSLANRLMVLREEAGKEKFHLHIKLGYIENFRKFGPLIDYLLFSLCFTGKYSSEKGNCNLNNQIDRVFIEIGNSNKKKLRFGLEIIDLLFGWNKDNETSAKLLQHKWVSKVNGYAPERIEHKKDPTCDEQMTAKFLKLYEASLVKVSNPKKPENKEAGSGGNLVPIPRVDLKAVIPEGEYRQLLGKYFTNTHKTFINFVLWTRIISKLKLDMDNCQLLDVEKSRLKDLLEINSLQRESNEEILLFAGHMLDLQSENARTCQEKVVHIFDAPTNEEIQLRLSKEKVNLKALIEKMKWNTSKLYLPLVVDNEFIPMLTNPKVFNMAGERYQRRLASKRYLNILEGEFSKDAGMQNSEKSTDHNWFVYLLSLLPLVKGKNTFAQVQQKAASFDNADLVDATTFEPSKSPVDVSTKKNKKGFSLTKQTFTKLCLMIFKARIKHPIVIMGESGCGKTYLSMFLAKGLLEDEFKMKTLYSGFSEADLVEFIEKCIDFANELQKANKRLWIFFDEFNTTAIQSLIADVILDRTLPVSKRHKIIPDNILFIACCNPYRIKLENSNADIGLVPHEKASMLSHIVHPIPERLLSLVWDFGQLSEEDEVRHISTMVMSEKFFTYKLVGMEYKVPVPIGDCNSRQTQEKKELELTQLVFRCHNTVRNMEERSGVSLRDVKRVFIFYRWFSTQLHSLKEYFDSAGISKEISARRKEFWMFRSTLTRELASAICAVTICYSLRLNGQRENQQKVTSLIYNWTVNCGGMESISRRQVSDTYCLVAELYLDNIKILISDDITINTPFKENFLTLLACYAEKVPMIIVGAPGTSKTLSTNKLLDALDTQKDNYSLFTSFEFINKIYYGGSETSTSEGVQKVFTRAKKLYDNRLEKLADLKKEKDKESKDKESKDKIQTPVIFFDELGLAELSPYNPLKVMHSELEDNLGKIAFIGISNWKPDQSKVNRMICLCRPDMSKDDLVNISDTTLKLIKSGDVKGNFRIANDCLSEAYLNYRVWQKSINSQMIKSGSSLLYHPNFHGSRDIYGVFNYIFKEVKAMEELHQFETLGPELRAHKCLEIIKKSIERNLNGENYVFGPQTGSLVPEFLQKINLNGQTAETIELTSEDIFNLVLTDEFKDKRRLVRMDDLFDVYVKENSNDQINPFESVQKSFSLSSAEVFKLFFLNCLYRRNNFESFCRETSNLKEVANEFMSDLGMLEIVKESIEDKKCRFMIIRAEGSISEDLFIEQLRISVTEKSKFIDWRTIKDDSQVEDLLSYMKTYISDGYTVVMKDLESLYGGLYDLFNQKYSKLSDKDTCNLYYGQTKHTVEVSENFKCIVFLSSNSELRRSKDIEKLQPAPFLNRFEKYFVQLSRILHPTSLENILIGRQKASELSGGKTSSILGLSLDLIVSAVVDEDELCNPFVERLDENVIKRKLMHLATTNFLLLPETSGGDAELFSDVHKNTTLESEMEDNLNKSAEAVGRLDYGQESIPVEQEEEFNETKGKSILLTFSTPLSLEHMLKDHKFGQINSYNAQNQAFENQLDRYLVYTAQSIGGGGINKRTEQFKKLAKGSMLFIQFTSERDFELIHPIRLLIDQSSNVKSAIFIVHVSIYARERQRLIECSGLTFWNNWRIITIDRIESDFTYENILRVKDHSILKAVLVEREKVDNEMEGSELVENNNDRGVGMSNWILRRVLIHALESLNSEKDKGEFDMERLKAGIERETNQLHAGSDDIQAIESQEKFQCFLEILKRTLKASLDDGENESMMTLTDGNHEIQGLLKDDDYKNVENLLAQVFFKVFREKTKAYLDKLNKTCKNLSTNLIGLIYSKDKSNISKNYLDWIKQCSEIVSNTSKPMIVLPPFPKEYYLPFHEIYNTLNSSFLKYCTDHHFSKNTIRLYHNDYVRLKKIPPTELTENQTIDVEYLGDLIRREEYNILTITNKLVDDIFKQVKPKLHTELTTFIDLFIIDLIKRFFGPSFTNENLKQDHYICLQKLLSNSLSVSAMHAKYTHEHAKRLFPILLYFMSFRETATFILDSIQKEHHTLKDIEEIITQTNSRIIDDDQLEGAPLIKYQWVQAIADQFNVESVVPDLQKVDNTIMMNYKHFLSSNQTSDISYKRFLGIIYDMLSYFVGNIIIPTMSNTMSDKLKIYLSELKKCDSTHSENMLERILQIGTNVFCDFLSLRKYKLKNTKEVLPLPLIQNFIDLWCNKESSFRVLLDPQISLHYFDNDTLSDYEFLYVGKRISSILSNSIIPFLFREKELRDKIRVIEDNYANLSESLLASGVSLINDLSRKTNDPRSYLLLQLLIENIFMEACLKLDEMEPGWSKTIKKNEFMVDIGVNLFKKCKGKPSFIFMISVMLLRLYFNPNLMANIEDLSSKEAVDTSLKEVITNTEKKPILEWMTSSVECYPFVYFMQGLNRTLGDNLTKVMGYTVCQEYELATRDPTDRTLIAFFNDDMIKRYQEVDLKISGLILSYRATPTDAIGKQINAMLEESFNGSKDANLYICGSLALNTLLKPIKNEDKGMHADTFKSWGDVFEKIGTWQPEGSKLQQICQLITNLSSQTESFFKPSLFSNNSNPDVSVRVQKILRQFILMIICFDKIGLSPTAYKAWTNTIPSTQLKCKLNTTPPLTNNVFVYLVTINYRMHNHPYEPWAYPGYAPNLGAYMCSCGTMFNLVDCGYFVPTQCPNQACKKMNGKGDHDKGETTGTTHFKTVQDIHKNIKSLYDRTATTYTPQSELNSRSEGYVNIRAIEITPEVVLANHSYDIKGKPLVLPQVYVEYEQNLYFRHLVDHLYLGALPLLMNKDKAAKYSQLMDLVLDIGNVQSIAKTMKDKSLSTSNDYFMAHISNDIQSIAKQVNLQSPTDIFDWLRAVLSKMAEKIIANQQPDAATQLYLDRTIFSKPEDVIKSQEIQTDKLVTQNTSIVAITAKDLVKRRVNFDDPNILKTDREGFLFCSKIFKHKLPNPTEIREQFNQSVTRFDKRYLLISNINKYELLLNVFPTICMGQLEISRFLMKNYDGKLTQEEAANKTIVSIKGKIVEKLYEQYIESWKLINKFKGTHPEIFSFGFECQQNVDLTDYEKRVTNKNTATVYDLLLVKKEQEYYINKKYIFMKSILNTFCGKIQNYLVNMMQIELRLDIDNMSNVDNKQDKENNGQIHSIKKGEISYEKKGVRVIAIDAAHEKDFVTLSQEQSLEMLIRDNVSADVLSKGTDEYLIDYDAIQHRLAEYMIKPQILVSDGAMNTFKFSTGILTTRYNELAIFLSYITNKEELDQAVLKYLDDQKESDDAERWREIFKLVVEICDFLHSTIQTDDYKTGVIELVRKCPKNEFLKQRILDKQVLYNFPLQVKIPHLENLINTLKVSDLYFFKTQHFNVKITENDKEIISKMVKDALQNEKKGDLSSSKQLLDLLDKTNVYIENSIYPDSSQVISRLEIVDNIDWKSFSINPEFFKGLQFCQFLELKNILDVLRTKPSQPDPIHSNN